MISSFSEPGCQTPRLPHPRSCFFKQTQFQCLLGHDLLQRPRLTPEVRHLAARRRPRRVARQTTFAGLEELLRPAVIKTLGDTLPATQLGDAGFAAQAIQDNTDLLFSSIVLARRTADVLHKTLGR